MKTILYSLLITFLSVCLASCEKDDICVDGDTPLLVIGFFDVADPEVPKIVPSLRIKETLLDEVINTIEDRASNLDSIGIPLRVDAGSTSFEFIRNSANDPETGDIDEVTFSYQTQEVFISRACGFVANYNQMSAITASNNWIQDIEIIQQNVSNSNLIHVKILH